MKFRIVLTAVALLSSFPAVAQEPIPARDPSERGSLCPQGYKHQSGWCLSIEKQNREKQAAYDRQRDAVVAETINRTDQLLAYYDFIEETGIEVEIASHDAFAEAMRGETLPPSRKSALKQCLEDFKDLGTKAAMGFQLGVSKSNNPTDFGLSEAANERLMNLIYDGTRYEDPDYQWVAKEAAGYAVSNGCALEFYM